MTNLLLGLGPIASALRLAKGVVDAVTGSRRTESSYADIQRQALARRAQEGGAAASATVPAMAVAPTGPASPAPVHAAAAVKTYESVMRAQAEGLMKRLDADGNAMLAASELGMADTEFQHLDEDGNGEVDLQELTRAMQAGRVPAWRA